MQTKKLLRKKSVYASRRYWYHISTTLKHNSVLLKPYGNVEKAFNRSWNEPDTPRICVAPSIVQCITAVPYYPCTKFTIYRTKNKVKAKPAVNVFDANITKEGWIHKPTIFVKIGELDFEDVEKGEKIEYVIPEAASDGVPDCSRKVLRWWKSKNIWKYVKRA